MAELRYPMVSLNNSLFAFFGLEIEMWQIAIIGVLVVALVACIIVAAIKSGKKRKIRIRKYIENEEKAISLRKRLRGVNEDISRIKFDYVSKKNTLNAQLKVINDDYRAEYGRDDSEYLVQSDKLLKTNEKLRDVSLRLKKKGLKPDDEKALKAELADTEAEHDELSEKIVAMREAKTARDSELKTKTEAVEKELALRKENYDADLAEKNGEKKKIEDDLEKLASSQVKISVKDAEAILEEFRAADDADREIRLNQAKEDVERAKNEYLEAVELRAQFERERDDAVISAKEDAKRKLALEKAQAETEAKVGYITAETVQTAQAAQSVQTPVDETAEEKTGTTEDVSTEEVATEEKPVTTEETPATEEVATEEKPETTEETPETETVTEEAVTAEQAEEKAEETGKTAVTETIAEEKAEESDETAVTETIAEEKVEEPDETATEEIVAEETASAENDASAALESLETAISDEDKKLSEEVIAEVEEAEEAATVSEAGAEAEAEAEATDTAETEETAATEPAETEESIETTEPAEESAGEEPTTGEAVEEPTADEAVEEPTETIAEPTPEETPEATPEETPEEVTEKVATEPANDEKIIRIPRDIYNDGIPATPIHKKSKYAKPVTKLLVKKPVAKEEPEQNVQTKEEARKSAYLGKWKVEKAEDGKLFAKLRASNGGILLTTPLYTSEIGLKNGITAIKKSLAADNVNVTANKAGKFVFKITAPSGRTIVTSEQYAARFQCEKALDSAKRFAETAVITE